MIFIEHYQTEKNNEIVLIMKFKHVWMSNEDLFIVHKNTMIWEVYPLFKKGLTLKIIYMVILGIYRNNSPYSVELFLFYIIISYVHIFLNGMWTNQWLVCYNPWLFSLLIRIIKYYNRNITNVLFLLNLIMM